MINDVKQAIVDKLSTLFPVADGYKVFDESAPADSTAPYFLIMITKQVYGKKLNTKYQSTLSFDLAYFSDKATTEIRADCCGVQEMILKAFDVVGAYRVRNKNAQITENVLHVTFDISYSEMKVEDITYMQQAETSTNI